MNRRIGDMRWCLFTAALFAMVIGGFPATAHLTQEPACEECEPGQPLKGAIFTTVSDGTRVNANLYDALEDVYLDGGPGMNAPSGAAALPAGCYYFQVTDPPGKTLLSLDPVKCRQFHVNEAGVIDWVYAATKEERVRGNFEQVDCTHNFEDDLDHHADGAHTVQLFPYKRTPNNGGVYKVWITRVCDFVGDPNAEDPEDNDDFFWGFKPSASKTDNFKVGRKPSGQIHVHKFNDLDCDGELDPGEPEIEGWKVDIIKPLGDPDEDFTAFWIDPADPGDWKFTEEDRPGWFPTGLIVDGNKVMQAPFNMATVTVTGARGEEPHTVYFLNAQMGDLIVCKQYDRDGDGTPDSPPVPVEGWKFLVDKVGDPEFVTRVGYTLADGCVKFENLKPGMYKITEVFPIDPRWCPSGPTMQNADVPSGGEDTKTFFNFCKGDAVMHTKGFWQNQGCSILAAHSEYLTFLNGLAPYQGPLDIVTHGQDNCGGLPCPPVTSLPFDSNPGPTSGPGELGCYIVAPNSQPNDPNIGLAQQLAAFTLNALHFMGDVDTTFFFMDTQYLASDLINAAATAWQSGSATDVQFYQNLLDAINNAGTVQVILPQPCPVVYP